MTIEESGIKFEVPNHLECEKLDESEIYRKCSHLGLKAVDLAFYGQRKVLLLEVKNYNPSLENIKDENYRQSIREEIKEIHDNRALLFSLLESWSPPSISSLEKGCGSRGMLFSVHFLVFHIS